MVDVVKVGTEFLVNTQAAGIQQRPTITSLTNGSFVVTWEDRSGTLGDGQVSSIKAQVFTADGAALGSEFLVNTQTANGQQKPSVTGLFNGGFVVTWQDDSGTLGDNAGASIKAQVFGADGTAAGSEFLVNTQTLGSQLSPAITGLANNGFVVAWEDTGAMLDGSSVTSIKAQIFNASGGKQGGEFLVNTTTAPSQKDPAITGLSNGGFVISWSDESDGSIKAQLFDASGAKRDAEFLVTEEGPRAGSYAPSITELSNGRFVIAWYDNGTGLGDNSGISINAQLFDANGAKVGSAFLVNTKTDGDQAHPAITDLGNGGFVVSWQDRPSLPPVNSSQDQQPWDIKAQVFNANGAKQGGEFLVNTQTANSQQFSTITGLANGGFAVSWWDDSFSNIKAQVYNFSNQASAPVISSDGGDALAALLVDENSTAVTTVQADDAVNFPLTYTISGGADAALFQIDAVTGALSFITAPDFEAPTDADGNSDYDVIVSASDGTLSDTQAISVMVRSVNEAPVISSNGGGATATRSVAEDATAVTTVRASDPDAGNRITYAISGGADAARFQINAFSGALAFITAQNFEAPADADGNNVYDVIVSASDGTLVDTQAIAVTVTDVGIEVVKVGSELLVNTQTEYSQDQSTITKLANGGFVITWTDYADDNNIKAQVFDAIGGKLGTEIFVSTQTIGNQADPSISGLANGGFVIAWDDYSASWGNGTPNPGTLSDNSGSSIKAQVYDANGVRKGVEFLVNTQTVGDQTGSSIIGLANGGYLITWHGADADNSAGIKAQLFDNNGLRKGREFSVSSPVAGQQIGTSVAALANGGFVATWMDSYLRAQVFDSEGLRQGGAIVVNTQTDSYRAPGNVTGLQNGGFVITWMELGGALGDGNGFGIHAQVFSASGAKLGDEFLVNTETFSDQSNPKVTALLNGGFIITWSDRSLSLGDSNIKAQMFDASGARIGSEFLVNTQAADNQIYNEITELSNGGFAITWTDLSSTLVANSFADVKAQVFSVGNPAGAPVIISNGGGATAVRSIAENTTAITTVSATDPDAGTTLTYAITGGADAAQFQINAATGALSFISAPNFEARDDVGANNIYEVIVRASDGTLADTQAIAVTVTDVVIEPIKSVRNDFNGDGRSDLLWRNSNGQLSNWLGSGNGALIDNGAVVNQFVPTAWRIQGTADFNGDGRTDILWRHTNGQLSSWLGNTNGGFSDNGHIVSQFVPLAWKIAGTGDFNGDGRADILWRNDNGQLSQWLGSANGRLIDNGHNVNQFVPTAWKIAGTGDFNGDSFSDVLWRNDNGQLSQWLGSANGRLIDNGHNVNQFVPNAWKIAGTGDFNGDGFSDILWRNDNGQLSEWLGSANGRLIDNGAVVNQFVPLAWQIAGTGDFNGDGRADIAWRNANGQLSEWLGTANGAFVDNGAVVNQTVSNAWAIHIHDYQLI